MTKFKKLITFSLFFIMILQFFSSLKFANSAFAWKKNEQDNAEAMAVLEVNSGRLLYSKNKDKRLPMASTTKIVTALVAIEQCKNLDEKHEIPKSATGIEGSSIYLKAGEHLSVRELLYGLMLRSGNDSAVALAQILCGSIEKFVLLMNEKCEQLELKNTHFVTVNGLHDDNHYTSAEDLARLSALALKNPVFKEIVSTKEKVISSEFDKKNGKRYLKNKNKLLNMLEGADGVKTGYTTKAGKCFVGSVSRNGMQVVCVVLNSKSMFEYCADLIEKAFSEFKMCKLFSKGSLFETNVKNSMKNQPVPVLIPNDIFYPLKKNEILKVKGKVELNENLTAPLKADEEIGKLNITLENDLIFSQKLYTINVEKQKENYLKKLIEAF